MKIDKSSPQHWLGVRSRKNMERMEEVVVETDEQQLQYMLTESGWDHHTVFDQVAQDADRLLGVAPEG
jgi:hypothetical protein